MEFVARRVGLVRHSTTVCRHVPCIRLLYGQHELGVKNFRWEVYSLSRYMEYESRRDSKPALPIVALRLPQILAAQVRKRPFLLHMVHLDVVMSGALLNLGLGSIDIRRL